MPEKLITPNIQKGESYIPLCIQSHFLSHPIRISKTPPTTHPMYGGHI